MEKMNGEQPIIEPTTALNGAEEKSVESEIGSLNGNVKFKSAQALLDAYNALEAEFTRKCQLLKSLEKDKAKENSEEITFKENISPLKESDKAEEKSEQNNVELFSNFETKASENQENFVLTEDVKNKIIEEYISSISSSKPPKTISSFSGVRVAGVVPKNPETLEEAKGLVQKMFS